VRDHVPPTLERDELLVAHDRPLRAGKRRHRTVPPLIRLAHNPTLGAVATASVEPWATTVHESPFTASGVASVGIWALNSRGLPPESQDMPPRMHPPAPPGPGLLQPGTYI
jgi:hypothetical protein